MRRRYLITTVIISTIFLSLGLLAVSVPASAQSTNGSGQALEIAPPVLILTANPGQTINSTINLRNISKSTLLVTSEINDFTAQGEAGIPKILLDKAKPAPYSIKDWTDAIPDLTMTAKQLKSLPITISVPADASPGGYYGVVRFTATAPELKDTGVALSASLGSLVFLRINGDVKEEMSIASFNANQNDKSGSFFESAPITFSERLKNTGNLFEQPTGQVSITDMFGKKVANVNVNLPPGYVLPGSVRKFSQTLDSSIIGNRILFGRYKADLRITYGENKTVLTKTIEFWVIPYRLILVAIVTLVIGLTILILLIKRYNRFIVKKAQKTRSKK